MSTSQYVRDKLSEYGKRVHELSERISSKVARLEKAVYDASNSFREGLDANLTAKLLELLHEYHLLVDSAPSTKYIVHEVEKIVDAKLAVKS